MRSALLAAGAILFGAPAWAGPLDATGAIAGAAHPGAQIVVTGLGDNHQVVGEVGRKDGAYRVEHLRPGRYAIQEEGPHHAAREVEVFAGKTSEVDLRPARE